MTGGTDWHISSNTRVNYDLGAPNTCSRDMVQFKLQADHETTKAHQVVHLPPPPSFGAQVLQWAASVHTRRTTCHNGPYFFMSIRRRHLRQDLTYRSRSLRPWEYNPTRYRVDSASAEVYLIINGGLSPLSFQPVPPSPLCCPPRRMHNPSTHLDTRIGGPCLGTAPDYVWASRDPALKAAHSFHLTSTRDDALFHGASTSGESCILLSSRALCVNLHTLWPKAREPMSGGQTTSNSRSQYGRDHAVVTAPKPEGPRTTSPGP